MSEKPINNQGTPAQPKVIGFIKIDILDNGDVGVTGHIGDPLLNMMALGKAMLVLSQFAKKQKEDAGPRIVQLNKGPISLN